jgi:hypothetical protein
LNKINNLIIWYNLRKMEMARIKMGKIRRKNKKNNMKKVNKI